MTEQSISLGKKMSTIANVACVALFGFTAVINAFRFPNDLKTTPIVDLGYEVYSAASFDVSLIIMMLMETRNLC